MTRNFLGITDRQNWFNFIYATAQLVREIRNQNRESILHTDTYIKNIISLTFSVCPQVQSSILTPPKPPLPLTYKCINQHFRLWKRYWSLAKKVKMTKDQFLDCQYSSYKFTWFLEGAISMLLLHPKAAQTLNDLRKQNFSK